MLYYHATTEDCLTEIMKSGEIKVGIDGCIYLCKDPKDAAKFLAIRLIDPIIVITLDLDECDIQEQFDHSPNFFKCRAYGCMRNIFVDEILEINQYTTRLPKDLED